MASSLSSDVAAFVRAVGRHWGSLLTGGVLVAALWVAQGAKWVTLAPAFYVIAAAVALLPATFLAWRDEHRAAEDRRRDVERLEAHTRIQAEALENEVVRDVANDLYWLLDVAQRRGLRREHVPHNHTGANLYALWVGDRPVSHAKSRWLYELVNKAVGQGLVSQENMAGGLATIRLPHESGRILDVERRRKRTVGDAPGELFDARDGAPFAL
jgi:hypothetical protein